MHAQVRTSRHAGHLTPAGRSYTPTYSDREEEVDSSDPDLSDYYSDSGYPTRPRPKLVLFSRLNSPWGAAGSYGQRTLPDKHFRRSCTPELRSNRHKTEPHVRTRRPGVVSVSSDAIHAKAFNKLRALKNNRVIPACSPERERPQSSLATTSICANGNSTPSGVQRSPPSEQSHDRPPNNRQLRSFSLPSNDANMAQVKTKKAKKAARTLSFSFGSGSGDKRKRALSILGSLGRRSGETLLNQAMAPSSPILTGRGAGGRGKTATIYEEETSSLSSVEEESLNGVRFLHGDKFGSCRELTSCGTEREERRPSRKSLQPLSRSKHKRPSLPNFGNLGLTAQNGHRENSSLGPTHSPTPSQSREASTSNPPTLPHPPSPSQEDSPRTEPNSSSATSSPLPHHRLRKLSDPGGSAPSTPESGSTPATNGFEERGGVRGSRHIRKGFTFCVSGDNDWKEMRHHVVRFLLETEQSYVQSLRTIMKVYLEPLQRPQAFGLIDSSLVGDIFYQIPEICSLHERFLLQISQRTDHWHPLQKIGDVFVNTFSKCQLLSIYTKFIHNFMRAKAAIEIAKQARPVFAKFLERSKYSTGRLSLDDLLIKPVQRIPRYVLFIKDLLKHTSPSHPDHSPLQQALGELTTLAERVNESEREMSRIDQQRDLLASVDGLALFVRPESKLVRYDLVTEVQGNAQKRDRFLILFSDVIVCASTRRKSAGLKRSSLLNLHTPLPDSLRYKIKWSAPVSEMSLGLVQAPMVERKKKNTLEKMIENLKKDEATLQQMIESSNTLRRPHQPLSSMLKEMLADVKEAISSKKEELENLPLELSRIDLLSYTSLPPSQYSIIFPSQRIRNSWEEDFIRVKQSRDTQTTPTSNLTPPTSNTSGQEELEFLHPLLLQSGRIGMELTCASVGLPADSHSPSNLWVCCSDGFGYGGQVCLLDMEHSTRPHVVANITVSDSRILCITAVPNGRGSGPEGEGEEEEEEEEEVKRGGEEVDGSVRRQGGREVRQEECVVVKDDGERSVLSTLDKALMEEEEGGEEGQWREGVGKMKERGEGEEEEEEEEGEGEERAKERWKKQAESKEEEGQGRDRHGNKKTLFRYVQSNGSRRESDGGPASPGEETKEMMVRFTRDPSDVEGGGGGGGGGGGRERGKRVVRRQLSVSDGGNGREEEEEEEGGQRRDLASEENMMSVSVSLLSETKPEGQMLPEESPAGTQDSSANSSQDPSHSLLVHKESDSGSLSPRGSIAVSSSDSSSELSRLSISRTPSMTSTRSEPRGGPSETDGATDIVGGASSMLDTIPAGGGFSAEEDIRSSRKNGFRRVRSNSAPDLLKAVASLNPAVSPSEVYPMGTERTATSLSPPASGSKFWSPLTLRSPQSSAKGEEVKERVEGSSMWLGTEGGNILIYSPGSNLRSRSSRTLLQLPSAVHCISHHKGRVYAGLGNGAVAVFNPCDPSSGHTHLIPVCPSPILNCVSVGGRLFASSQNTLYQLTPGKAEAKALFSLSQNQTIQFVVGAGGEEGDEGLWVSVKDTPLLYLYHSTSGTLLTTVNCTQKIVDILRGYNPIIRQHKISSLRTTSLLPSTHHLLIGTSAGIILTLPHPPLSHPSPSPPLSHLPQGHVDSVHFLCLMQRRDTLLALCGGSGYEDFDTQTVAQDIAETASCLLIWRLNSRQE